MTASTEPKQFKRNFRIEYRPDSIKPIKFNYVNWHGDEHQYLVLPELIEFARYHGSRGEPESDHKTWLFHAYVITRDGDSRPEMEGNRRRTFIMSKMEMLES